MVIDLDENGAVASVTTIERSAGGGEDHAAVAMIGRHLELRVLMQRFEEAAMGRGSLVLVAGEAGIGKTTLARAAGARAAAAGAVLRWGACRDGAGPALTPWVEALRRPGRDRCAELAAQIEAGEIDEVDSADQARRARQRRLASVVEVLAEAAASRPQVVVLDDLHWSDSLSLDLLAVVAAQLPTMGVLVVGTYRDDELPPDTPISGLGAGVERLRLEGFSEGDVAALLSQVTGGAVGIDAAAVVRQTAGNPFFVSQVGRLLAAGSGAAPLPLGVRDVLVRRLARLPATSGAALAGAAVLGEEFDVAVLGEVLDRAVPELLDDLDRAAGARLVAASVEVPGRWEFSHALVRAAAEETIGSLEKARLHRRAAEVLANRPGVPAAAVAEHAARGDFDRDDPRPAKLAIAASREALERLAPAEAARWAERSLDALVTSETTTPLRVRGLLALGDARLRAGEVDAAADAFTAAAGLARVLGDADLFARAALGFAVGLGSFEVRLFDERQILLLEEAAATIDWDSPLRALVLARWSVALSLQGTATRRLELADESVATARRHGDGRVLAAALAARCDAIAGPDHVDERLSAADEIVRLAHRAGDRPLELLGRRLCAVALLEQRDFARFEREVTGFARTAEATGDVLYRWLVPTWRAMRLYADGQIAEAVRLADEAAALGRAAGSDNAAMLRLTFELFLAVDRRDRAGMEAAWRATCDLMPHFIAGARVAWALIDAASGRSEEVFDWLAQEGAAFLVTLERDQEWLTIVCWYVTLGVTAGHGGVVSDAYDLLAPYAGLGVFEGFGVVPHGPTDRFLAAAAGHLGRWDAARHHLDVALEAAARDGRLVLAHTAADGARALAASPEAADRRRAAALAEAAARTYREVGLPALAAELVHLGGAGPSTAPSLHGDSTADLGHGAEATMGRDGATWVLSFAGCTARLPDAKGLHDLAVLLERPGELIHVRELAGTPMSGGLSDQPVLDRQAADAYRRRLADIDAELDRTHAEGDLERSARLAIERDALLEELSGAFGLRGRARSAGPDPDERLRKAVSARVKATIDRVAEVHPSLGTHLRHSVRTGFRCTYDPEHPMVWRVDRS